MPCFWPRKAYRKPGLPPSFREPPDVAGFQVLNLPCGGCIGCRVRQARDWAIRCQLELQEHDAAAWVTLTYEDDHLPPTLAKWHLSGYLKRLRAATRPGVRFFGVGEYGEKGGRPHYHAIIYGLPVTTRALESSWKAGHVRVEPVTPANIAYTAGYAQKKIRQAPRGAPPEDLRTRDGRIFCDPDGVPVPWTQPFRLSSRRPGIGGAARRFAPSWRSSAIFGRSEVPVPRFLHEAWKAVASASDIEALDLEKLAKFRAKGPHERAAGEANALARYHQQQERRSL